MEGENRDVDGNGLEGLVGLGFGLGHGEGKN